MSKEETGDSRLSRRQLLQMAGAGVAGGIVVSRIGIASAAQGDPASVTYVGRLPELDAFVGIVREGQDLLAYACDGRDTGVGNFADWFQGPIIGGSANLVSESGSRLVLDFGAGAPTGDFVWTDGRAWPFSTIVARGVAGLYRVERIVGDELIVGGWVVTEESEMRGAQRVVIRKKAPPPPPSSAT